MPSPYSMDLRARVVAAYQRGEGTQKQVAERFDVCLATLENWLRRLRNTGSFAPKPARGGPEPKLSKKCREVLRELLQEQPDLFLVELCEKVEKRTGVRVSSATMCQTLKKLDLPRKKKSHGR